MVPFLAQPLRASGKLTACISDSFFVNIEARIGVSAQGFLKSSQGVGPELCTVDSTGVHLLRSGPPDHGTKRNDGRLLGMSARRL